MSNRKQFWVLMVIVAVLVLLFLAAGCEQEPINGSKFQKGDVVYHKIDPNSHGIVTSVFWDAGIGKYNIYVRFEVGGNDDSFEELELILKERFP
jgi:hypothetical protein